MVEQNQNIVWNDPSALLQLLDTYPWFVPARARLCRITAAASGPDAARGLFEEGIVYFPDAVHLSREIFPLPKGDYKDNDLKRETPASSVPTRPWMSGMDYFSRDDYAQAALPDDARLASIAVVDYSSPAPVASEHHDPELDLATETLAQIYLEQGYPEQAREIYRKLILHSPEKSAYFAALMEKIEQ